MLRLQNYVDGLFHGPDLCEHPYEIQPWKWGAGFGLLEFVLSHAKVLSSERQVLNGTLIPGIALIDYVRVGFSKCWLNGNGRQISNP
ncbi:hypothetical protein A7R79_36845 [Pseudomonas aeruginosa]|nr:hypothetical protein A9P90_29660 [Pseudomonas aeruginosa]OES49217.1 hypothetical protein A7R77_31700 [Pseudomonas aeruginosa]OES56747.1 hypothetical protein A7R78_26575 [Pseudomonas aeruginosa]OES62188.1 hypothetical protein A7R79_36845 [Pseudomonas aeruginosa]WGT19261.1 hypothetical protein P4N66_gene5371 [Pseudomonas aeruginosa]